MDSDMSELKNEFELKIFLGFVLKEMGSFQVYINASVIGLIICFFSNNYTVIPFMVPLFVQVLARSNVKYRQRHLSALVELPAQTEAPVFIMDLQGEILLSVGKTLHLFRENSIQNIRDFLNREAFDAIMEIATREGSADAVSPSIESFSKISQKWYEIKATLMHQEIGSGQVLVWFQDISRRKDYDYRLQDLLRYSESLIGDLEVLVDSGAEFQHLSSFLLKDYQAVFITRTDKMKNLAGYAFKKTSNKIARSEHIVIPKESLAPINISRQKAEIISEDMGSYDSQESFLAKNPLDPKVLDFIGVPIQNFITYNEADLSIIAFNFKSQITTYEKRFFEILVNNYRTMVMLVDLERKRKT